MQDDQQIINAVELMQDIHNLMLASMALFVAYNLVKNTMGVQGEKA